MSWFDEQIRQRNQSDQELFEDAIFQMASVVWGHQRASAFADSQALTKVAMDEIVKYYHLKPRDIPENITDAAEQLEYCMRPYGIMHRNVTLTKGWYRDAYGPMLAWHPDRATWIALLPGKISGYTYLDPETGKTEKINSRNAGQFETDAICFYRPLPPRTLGIPQLILYLKDCITLSDFVILALITLLVVITGMIMPHITYFLTNTVYSVKSVSLLVSTALFSLIALVTSQVITVVRSLMMNRIETKTRLSVEAAMMMRLLSLPARFFRNYSAGELSSRMQSVNNLCNVLLGSGLSVGLSSVMSLLYIRQFFSFAPALAGPALLIILATVAVSVIFSVMQIRISRDLMENEAHESGMTFAMIDGMQKIKLAGAEKRFFARWARTYAKTAELKYNPPLFLKINTVILSGISLAGTILLYSLAAANHISPASYISFNASFAIVMGVFSDLAGVALSVAQIQPILNLAEPLLKATPEVSENKEMPSRLSGSIELNNISFRYSESSPWIVDDMSLKIRSGEYVALVGRTGCGKSTLIRLLLGFEQPQKGAIYYDGKDINNLDMHALRRRIGVVTQDGSLFQGDIYSNIVISAPQLTLDDAWEAAEIAGIADDIRAMPMGMHTLISEGQGGISGGQKQRIMIARAVAPKPRMLMLDEATSALDNITQRHVADALDKLKCTRIVIAHRLSTIQHCDRILVLDQGKIVEDGTYEELIAAGGTFADLVARQRLDTDD
ncbi:MAG: NHLP bacteriocin export ABC transporter permease/ATPase subunit [Clostridia bacterium]|nr:NHLP bacteriocin export ABC transporter permease/ATPase subunit [Clostridia bacterium]